MGRRLPVLMISGFEAETFIVWGFLFVSAFVNVFYFIFCFCFKELCNYKVSVVYLGFCKLST